MGFVLETFHPRQSFLLRSVRQTSRAVRRRNCDRTQASAQGRLKTSLGQVESLSTLRQLQRVSVRDGRRRLRSRDRADLRAPFAFVLRVRSGCKLLVLKVGKFIRFAWQSGQGGLHTCGFARRRPPASNTKIREIDFLF
jgi:hypothetical protein